MLGLVAPAEANSLELLVGAAFAEETGAFVAHPGR